MEDEKEIEGGENDWSIESILDDLYTDLSDLIWGLFADFVEMAAELINEVPVPEFLGSLGSYVGAIPPHVMYFIGPFEFAYGFSVLSAAVASRMLLGLIPYVGSAFK